MKPLALLVVALLVVAVVVVPEPSTPSAEPIGPPAPATFAVCPVGEAAQRDTTVGLVGGSEGEVTARVFSAGEIPVEETYTMSASGELAIEVSELTGLATSPLLVSLPDTATRVGALLSGDGMAATGCDAGSPDTVVVSGGSTSEGETFRLLLANPFAGTATVSLGLSSEVGTESNPDLDQVVVPPRSLVTVDLSAQMPARQVMSVAVTPEEGRVVAGAVQEGSGDVAAISGHVAEVDWFLPVAEFEGVSTSLVLASPGTSEVPYQLDVYGPDGLVEAAQEGTVPARGQEVVPVSDLIEGPGVIRVVAAGPVSAVLRLTGEGTRALIPGVAEAATSWMLPGATRLGPTDVHVFNPGEIDAVASVRGGSGELIEEVDLGGGSWTTIPIPEGSSGVRVESDTDLIVTWTTSTEEGLAGDAAQVAG